MAAGWHHGAARPAPFIAHRTQPCSALGAAVALGAGAAVRRTRSSSLSAAATRRQPDDEQDDEAVREQRKRLTRLFYSSTSAGVAGTASASRPPQPPQPQQPGQQLQQQAAAPAGLVTQLPLWRVEWPALPGGQQVLHVLTPHYVHMFEGLFSTPVRQQHAAASGSHGGWLFGHLYLPGGSRSLGSELHSLQAGSAAPLVGMLMRITRAVRLRDGKMLLLATGVGRFKVVRCCQELPYSVADVELLEDEELLAEYEQPALNAVMQAAADDTGVAQLMVAARGAAREAAAAAASAWLGGYELQLALQQEWAGPAPREGASDAETHALVTELTRHGVSEVLPLPDGVVIGRCDLEQVAAGAEAAAQRALAGAAQRLLAQQQQQQQEQQQQQQQLDADAPGSVPADDAGAGQQPISSLNTTAERGVAFEAPELAALTSSSSGSSSIGDVLALEAAVWAQLDTLCGLASRVRGRRLQAMPYGLLQLRPPPLRPEAAAGIAAAAAAAAAGQQHACSSEPQQQQAEEGRGGDAALDQQQQAGSSSSASSRQAAPPSPLSSRSRSSGSEAAAALPSPSQYAFAASDGMDVTAHPRYPPLRRAARLSWAVWGALAAGAPERDAEGQQALLECSSVAGRLRCLAGLLGKQAKVLAALAAVKDVQA